MNYVSTVTGQRGQFEPAGFAIHTDIQRTSMQDCLAPPPPEKKHVDKQGT